MWHVTTNTSHKRQAAQPTRLLQRFGVIAVFLCLVLGGMAIADLSGLRVTTAHIAYASDSIKSVAEQAAVPATLPPETLVAMFTPHNGQWVSTPLAQVMSGCEFTCEHHLYRVNKDGAVEMIPDIDINKLADADRAYDMANYRIPEAADVVMVLDKDMTFTRHAVIDALQPGTRVCFQGKAYDLRKGRTAGTIDPEETNIVAARVTETYKLTHTSAADTIIDVVIRTADGKEHAFRTTPDHPFYVLYQKKRVALAQLTSGAKVEIADRDVATIVDMRTRRGQFEINNREIAGPNYTVFPNHKYWPTTNGYLNLANAQRTQHILHGDATGGGHMWPGGPEKTSFPQGWSAEKIMHEISGVAADPSLTWIQQTGETGSLFTKVGKPARFLVEGKRDGIDIRVIIEPTGEGIITGFPYKR